MGESSRCQCKKVCKPVSVVILSILGITCIVLGVVLPGIFKNIIRKKIDDAVVLKKGSLGYKEWHKPSSPVYLQFFMFNLTNPKEVMNGSKPYLTQVGPYSYKEIRVNNVIQWNDNNTVKYNEVKSYFFDPDTSCAGCSDKFDNITTVNVPVMTILELSKGVPNILWWKNAVNNLLEMYKEKLFESKSVHSLLWGYYDPFLVEVAKIVPKSFAKIDPFVAYQVNNSGSNDNNSISSVYTGEGDIDKLNIYDLWRGQRNMSWWNSLYANMINGTDGTHFQPSISKDDKLYVFVDTICRSMYLKYHSTVTVRDIELYRFAVPGEVYISGDYDPNNKGFCNGKCLETGLLDISVCQPTKAPIIVSPPHFYLSNSSLLKTVKGLENPEENEHATFIDVEPITGSTLQANKRLQINVLVEQGEHFSISTGVKKVIFPVFYINESATVSQADAKEFRDKVYTPIKIAKFTPYALFGLGGLLILIALIILFVALIKRKSSTLEVASDRESLIQNNESERIAEDIDAGRSDQAGII